MERGSVILFEKGTKWTERLVAFATRPGNFIHCEICLGGERMIGAHGDKRGIYEREWAEQPSLVTEVSLSAYTTPEEIEHALAWAEQQQGRPYGWMDIASQAIKFLWPTTPLRLASEGKWDCSDFVTRYLMHAGVILPDDYTDSFQNTPNDIGRLFALIPERPQRTRKRERERSKGHVIAKLATATRGQ